MRNAPLKKALLLQQRVPLWTRMTSLRFSKSARAKVRELSACARAVSPSGNKDYSCSALSARVRGAEKIEIVAALNHALSKGEGLCLFVFCMFLPFLSFLSASQLFDEYCSATECCLLIKFVIPLVNSCISYR